MKPEELKNVATMLRELGLSCEETLDAMRGVAKDSHFVRRLWKDGDKPKFIKIGLTLIAFPEPTPISETLGACVLSLGLIESRMKRSALHIEDVYNIFHDVIGNLQTIKLELI
ncbi:MAG: hypothetical protein AOA66_0009 [Candidatus Bathyarchaeota archaeon BA2]|nr:MAG: hypothetical protein AOA66_0009 [Candidatus Bathyarchaeota archaeon BA2]